MTFYNYTYTYLIIYIYLYIYIYILYYHILYTYRIDSSDMEKKRLRLELLISNRQVKRQEPPLAAIEVILEPVANRRKTHGFLPWKKWKGSIKVHKKKTILDHSRMVKFPQTC